MLTASNIYSVLVTVAIVGGLALVAAVILIGLYAIDAQEKGRAVLPWGLRVRVERARVEADVAEQRVRAEKAELQHLAMQPTRQRILQAIDESQPVTQALLSGPTDAVGNHLREQAFAIDDHQHQQ